jgi:hypothetical protein
MGMITSSNNQRLGASAGTKSAPPAQDTKVLSLNEHDQSYVRSHSRTPIGIEVQLHEIDEFGNVRPGMPAECADLSRSGFGLRCRKIMYAGHLAAMVIPGKNCPSKVLFGSVANILYLDSGRYHIGFRLVPTPESPSIIAWLTATTKKPPTHTA